MRPEQNIPRIIDDLYAGTLDSVAWGRAIQGMVDVVSGSSALLFGFNPATGQVLRNENHGYDPFALSQYNDYWCTRDIRIAAGTQLPVGEPMMIGNVLPIRTWMKSAIYNELMLPADAPWNLAYWLHKASDKVVALSILGTRHRGLFNGSDGERLQPVLPHMRRALEIRDRLEVAQVRRETLATSLSSVSFGVLILDGTGHILEASAKAEDLIRAENGIHRNPDGSLWLRGPAGRELDEWIFKGAPPEQNRDGLLHVQRPLALPLSLMVTRLPQVNMSWFSGGPPAWMLLLFDPDSRLSASTDVIARDLGVSDREAEVAALLVTGYDIKALGRRLNISIHTARTHLKAIFSKTGIGSQSELIRRIMSGPAGIRVPK